MPKRALILLLASLAFTITLATLSTAQRGSVTVYTFIAFIAAALSLVGIACYFLWEKGPDSRK